MTKKLLAGLAFLFIGSQMMNAQTTPDGFQILPSGLEMKKIVQGTGQRFPSEGDRIMMHIESRLNDSIFFSTAKMNQGNPIPGQCGRPQFAGDPMEGIRALREGDSAILRVSVDTSNQKYMPPFAKMGDKLSIHIKMLKIQTPEEVKAEEEKMSASLKSVDDATIQQYLKDNKLTAKKTASGLYYIITQKGTGANAVAGQNVSMNYTGRLLNGNIFDSNVDPKFQHVEPFSFVLGQGMVIKGWDEGIALLNKGSKAKLIIPSGLAYGSQSMPGNPNNPEGIPANSVLIFDVEMLNAETQGAAVDEAKPKTKQPELKKTGK